MAAVLASQGCYRQNIDLTEQGRQIDDLSFAASVPNMKLSKVDIHGHNSSQTRTVLRLRAQGEQTESARFAANGRASKMVSTRDANKWFEVTHYGASLVKRKSNGSSLVKTQKTGPSKELPFAEELRVFPSDQNFSWAKDDYNSWQRSFDIWTFVLSFRLRILADNAKWARRRTASWLREKVLQLGPTFIKLGQLSSTRSDLFPREFVDELAKLQDRVPAFSPEKAKVFIQEELGSPINVLFKEFEDQPIAAASLGQVHRAILHSGEKVAVKVQRPGLKKLFDIDLRNLKLVAEYFQRSETFGGPTRDWIGIYDECSKILYEEIDYINEGKNADRFRRDFRNVKWVRVPLIIWDYTSTKVLTLEYVPGIKINNLELLDARGYKRSLIASRAIESYLIQILKTGFFHADPHPGNLAIDVDGSLIYYDFGMMGDIKSFTRERLLELFYAIYEKDARKVMQSLIDLGALQPTGDMSAVRRSVQFFLDNLLNQTPNQEQTLAAIGEDLFAIATDQPFRFPATFTFVLRAFSTLEGIGYILDPDFSFVKIAAPYAQELLDIRQRQRPGTEIVDQLRRQANDARNSTISMPYRVQRIEEFVKQLEAGDLKLRVRVLEQPGRPRSCRWPPSTLLWGTLLNVGVTVGSQGNPFVSNGSFIGAGVFLILLVRSMRRVKRLDEFEKKI
ncbi:unnamed protein product [Spirodela intermedia]|uniref:ABC1 atypical kinase-like domain-containing protein n=1 Tax=Spirodela intermedia TaxID=51605 RepID=A0A7I8IUK9_SPIIN|nr:unnamed protein product [Spirodela intermedia]CAA6661518.1 unnamed protein product [Spirodela intermedia]